MVWRSFCVIYFIESNGISNLINGFGNVKNAIRFINIRSFGGGLEMSSKGAKPIICNCPSTDRCEDTRQWLREQFRIKISKL